ncbi:MAG: aldo/keto reductase [Clostridia bacterium]|nr:aldo/keto reductase [Clostridia bacterium]
MFVNSFFPEITGNFGFGCMRLPMKDGEVDHDEFCRMADEFIAAGFNYFDTAHGYIGGRSETAIRECVSKRFDRTRFLLTNKLSDPYFEKEEDILPFFKSQLELCGVDYFDFYLMHAQNAVNFKKYKACRAYETAFELKKQGLVKHVGISFHDSADVLDMILTEYPELEAVQIQFNYIDFDDPQVQSKKCYDVCVKHGKPCIIMEPVKGGTLANLPKECSTYFKKLDPSKTAASYAVRFAASFDNVMMVLSGMSSYDQMADNLSSMTEFKPLSKKEFAAVDKTINAFRNLKLIPCTGCRYCIEQNECPANIRIPDIFEVRNNFENFKGWLNFVRYKELTSGDFGKASDCLKCGMCEDQCPQHLEIRSLLEDAANIFERRQ